MNKRDEAQRLNRTREGKVDFGNLRRRRVKGGLWESGVGAVATRQRSCLCRGVPQRRKSRGFILTSGWRVPLVNRWGEMSSAQRFVSDNRSCSAAGVVAATKREQWVYPPFGYMALCPVKQSEVWSDGPAPRGVKSRKLASKTPVSTDQELGAHDGQASGAVSCRGEEMRRKMTGVACSPQCVQTRLV